MAVRTLTVIMALPYFLLILQSFFGVLTPEKESINWRSRRVLTWADFKAKPVETAPNAAMTSTSILIDFGYDNAAMHYHLSCVFYPEKSWSKVSSARILGHEQGHFDVSQLFTRKMHKALSNYTFSRATADRDIKAIYQKVATEQSKYQALYDQQTNYSRDATEQAAWEIKIKQELSDLVAFADYP